MIDSFLDQFHIQVIDMTTLFLILAYKITIAVLESTIKLEKKSSSLYRWAFLLSLFLWLTQWNEYWLWNLSISLNPGENSLLRVLNDRKRPLRHVFTSITELLIFSLCLEVIFSNDRQCDMEWLECWLSKSDQIVWLSGKEETLSWTLLLSFLKCRWIEINPANASIPSVGEVWKASRI